MPIKRFLVCIFAFMFGAIGIAGAQQEPTQPEGAQYEIILDGAEPYMGLLIEGAIANGDGSRLVVALNKAGEEYPDHYMRALALNSPGGNVAEALKMVYTIRKRGLVTVVPQGATCASACVLLFAAGSRKIASIGSQLLVHGAAIAGAQNEAALAVTANLAKVLGELGAPASVIGRMAVTPPSETLPITPRQIEMFPYGVANQAFTL